MASGAAPATFAAVRHEFLEQLDDQLHDDFQTAEGHVTLVPDGRIVWSDEERHDPDHDEDRGSEVWSADGTPIYQSAPSVALPPIARDTPTEPAKVPIAYPRPNK